ncbi:MAG: hypothetical protein WCH35_06770 [Comamonadaceae bacterium]
MKSAWILALRGLNKEAASKNWPLFSFSVAKSVAPEDSPLRSGDL